MRDESSNNKPCANFANSFFVDICLKLFVIKKWLQQILQYFKISVTFKRVYLKEKLKTYLF